MELKTVKIVDAQAPGGYVVINEADFDAGVHTLLDAPEAAPEAGDEPKPKPKGKGR